ncbi:unnamed protein product [Oppiella nova]|uniref:Uncharacterized protein n=1 Tax=Oppiella nova TaxID=334625 RepID=A0A7R9LED9_9ACAR|nr:unnamed protein product [Oppiella nova]CAG2162843.1 unnamed protein product [Oppiella nova]
MKPLFLYLLLAIYSFNGCTAQRKEFKDGVRGTGCLITITPKLTRDCLDAFDQELDRRPKDERDQKALCCAYLSLQSCVLKLSEKECGEEGEPVAKSFLKAINSGITSDDCVDYGLMTCIQFSDLFTIAQNSTTTSTQLSTYVILLISNFISIFLGLLTHF